MSPLSRRFMNSFRQSLTTVRFCDVKALALAFVGDSLKLPYQYTRSNVGECQRIPQYLKYWSSCNQVSCFLDNAERCNNNHIRITRTDNHLSNHLCYLTVLKMGKKTGGFYAVARGRSVGVFLTWDECKAQVDGFQNARYKKFPTTEEANSFIEEHKDQKNAATHAASTSFKIPPVVNSKSKGTTGIIGIGLGAMGIRRPLPSSTSTKNTFSTNAAAPKRNLSSLKVTEDRVINKRPKMDPAASNSKADLSSFSVDEDGYVVVYTDGACTKNGKKAAKAGIGVWFGSGHPLNISEPVEGRQTNNTAEIQAAERAIREAKLYGINKLKVKTDSQFTINCVTKWSNNWKRNNWRLSSGGEVKNKEDLIKLDDTMQNMEIKWSYVAGHAGIEGNEAADRLAVQGAERSKY